MELIWKKPIKPEVATFENDSSPYAHFWLDQRDLLQNAKRRSVVEVAQSLNEGVEGLIERAFGK